MQLVTQAILVVFLVAPATATDAVAGSPVEKVVQLIEELKANLERDQKVEQQIYDKFACWCETATGQKAAAIHMAHRKIKELTTEILELKGTVAVLAHEIAELSAQIAENEEAQKKATSIRQKENGAWQKEATELQQAINALERAIIVLSGAGTKKALLQDGEVLSLSTMQRSIASVQNAVSALPSAARLTPKQLSAIEQFTSFEPEAADASASYAPQSATVQGILKDMYDTFTNDLEKQTVDEAVKQRDFEGFIATAVKELRHMQAVVKDKESEKANAEQELADAMQELDDTQKQMKADIEFFDETKAMCHAKYEEWTERSKNRLEEIEGIKKALEILTSDEARELFARSIKPGMETFLQLDGSSDSDDNAPAMKAYKVLKEHAKKAHSIRLAALAATVRTGKAGHFDAVIKEINKMIQLLKDEEADDIKQRDWCKKSYFENSEEKAELKWLIQNNEAMIVKLQKTIDTLTENIEDTEKEIVATKEQMAKMTEERTAEHDAFKAAKKDDEDAIELLSAAIEALSAYYKKNKIDMGPIEGSSKLLQEPEFEVSKWQAPDATFKGKGARKNESKGIISILTMLKEDLQDEITNGVKDEVASQAEYEKQMEAAEKLIETLNEKKVNLETDKATTEEKKEEEEGHMADNKESLGLNEEYKKSIKPDCDWMLNAFEERKKKRAAEMEGLVTAKEYLSGAAPPAMLETSQEFDDDRFPQISFAGLSFLQK